MFDGRPRPKVLFDTNAVRYFFGRDGFSAEELTRAREHVLRRAALDEIRVVLTTPVLWELTKFYLDPDFGPSRHQEMSKFIVTAGSKWALKNEYERMRLELLRRRKLRDTEVFDSCDVDVTLAMHRDDVEVWRIYEMQRALKEEERGKEAQLRVEAHEALEKTKATWKEELGADLGDGWDRTVKTFVKIAMRKHAKEHGLRLVGDQWPKPRDAPTFWYAESFYAAKVQRIFVDSKKALTSKKSLAAVPDMVDATHFKDAAYVDCLVTQDQTFGEIARLARTPLIVTTFDDFIRSVLSTR